ncbi:MAG: helix-turn-helix domain-containing protein [Mariprofundaceae bacterium]|nr:helix-turn-helix domain-containing protein [Mariprofundaceae bacterium]
MPIEIATRIRDMREQRNLSQRALAEAGGVSAAAVSQIEAGQASPSVATLEKLADGMGVPVAAFFLDVGERSDVEIFSLEDRPGVSLRGGSRLIPLAAQWRTPVFEPILVRLEAGGELSEQPFGIGGETEYVWMRRGRAMLDYDGETHILNETQSVYYDPRKPHNWRNTFDAPCELLMVHSR